jgi:hypothetical protein
MSYGEYQEPYNYGYAPRRRTKKKKKVISRASRGVRISNKILEMLIYQAVLKAMA